MLRTFNTQRPYEYAIVYFSDCPPFEFAVKPRWPDDRVTCSRCGSEKNYLIVTKNKRPAAGGCGTAVTTIDNSRSGSAQSLGIRLSPRQLLITFWMLVNCKNGVSSMEIHRALGIAQNSARFIGELTKNT